MYCASFYIAVTAVIPTGLCAKANVKADIHRKFRNDGNGHKAVVHLPSQRIFRHFKDDQGRTFLSCQAWSHFCFELTKCFFVAYMPKRVHWPVTEAKRKQDRS